MDIPKENYQRDEVMTNVEYGKSYGKKENDESALLVVSVTQIAFSMKFYSLCKGRSTIVMDEFKEILKTSTCQIANTFIDQRFLTQFQINLGVTTFIVPFHGISSDFGVWDHGISSKFLVLTHSNKNVEAHALFGEIRKQRSCLLVNSYVSKTVETKIDVVDIRNILL
ncbi:hypothetical protein H5410_021042 [Solanum commersonii]|uniref:Uncharacterized protein n=1 Tax=Solanum commersonii TaxID=4109 RepID=A0A9J5ZA78_SOLCO|nr:hypothetical protein H5410_021042 [Solanum commersonii]